MRSSWSDVIMDQWELTQSTPHTGLNKFVPVWTNPIPDQLVHFADQKFWQLLHKNPLQFSLGFGLSTWQDLSTCPRYEYYPSHIHPVFKRGGPTTQRLETWQNGMLKMFFRFSPTTHCCPPSPPTIHAIRLLLTPPAATRHDHCFLHWRQRTTMDVPQVTITYLPPGEPELSPIRCISITHWWMTSSTTPAVTDCNSHVLTHHQQHHTPVVNDYH